MSNKKIIVEIAYASPKEHLVLSIKTYEGITIEQAVKDSGILSKFPEIDLSINKLGIFGKLAKLNNALKHLDRVEIYRSLRADPKAIRKHRAKSKP
ncbi:MAG TPA: RnfH family protein [Methylotenera sp.]|nr:RnfH family protein [Methylotenera sp.]